MVKAVWEILAAMHRNVPEYENLFVDEDAEE